MERELEGKVILLTGGASGIGRECAVAYAREGATVAILDRNFKEAKGSRGRNWKPECRVSRRCISKKLGVTKRIGFHSFRHGLATMLRQRGVDIKTAQEMLRHANSRITLEIYQQSVCEEKREAQDRVMGMLLAANEKGAEGSNPSAPLNYHRKQLFKP